MNRSRYFKRLGMAVAACLLYTSFTASAQNTIDVNVGSANDVINRELYGTLMENWGRVIVDGVYVGLNSSIPNTRGIRNDVIAGFNEAGIAAIEFPGGCFADKYRWKDGVEEYSGDQASREAKNKFNGMGTDEFFLLCSLSNAVPYITANVQLNMPGNSTEINDWLDYIHDRPDFWSMMKHWKTGNEEWGSCKGDFDTQPAYQSKWKQIYDLEPSWAKSELMHIMDGGMVGGWIEADCKYLVTLPGPTGISYHQYTVINWTDKGSSSQFNVNGYYAQIKAASDIGGSVQKYSNTMNQIDPTNKVSLIMDEWGAWYNDVTEQGFTFNWSTVRDAIIAGINLNIFNNNCKRIKMACVAQPVNAIQALMLTERGGQNRMRKTPVFWVFKLFKPHQNATMAPAKVTCATNQGMPVINASASVDATKKLHISIVNTHDAAAQDITINIAGAIPAYTKVTGQIVNGDKITSGITSFDSKDTVSLQDFAGATISGSKVTAKIPAHSVVMLECTFPVAAEMSKAVWRSEPVSLATTRDGKIIVKCAAMRNTPISLSLYSADGRSVLDQYSGTLRQNSNGLTWEPKNRTANGVYVVKIEAGSFSKSERVVFTK